MSEKEKISVGISLGPEQDADFIEAIQLLETSRIIVKSLEKDVAELLDDVDN